MGVAVSGWRWPGGLPRRPARGRLGNGDGRVLARRLQDGDPGGHYRRALAHFPIPAMAQRVLDATSSRAAERGRPDPPLPKLTLGRRVPARSSPSSATSPRSGSPRRGTTVSSASTASRRSSSPPQPPCSGRCSPASTTCSWAPASPRGAPAAALPGGRRGRPIPVDVAGDSEHRSWRSTPAPCSARTCRRSPAPTSSRSSRSTSWRPTCTATRRSAPTASSSTTPGRRPLRPTARADAARRARRAGLRPPRRGRPREDGRHRAAVLGGRRARRPGQVAAAVAAGAAGVQVGTLFALSPRVRHDGCLRDPLLDRLRSARSRSATTPGPARPASRSRSRPRGDGRQARGLRGPARLCDLWYLRSPTSARDGPVGYRCAAEPVHMYVRKGGAAEDTEGRKCLCNGLTATIGLGQPRRDGHDEDPWSPSARTSRVPGELVAPPPGGWTAPRGRRLPRGEWPDAAGPPPRVECGSGKPWRPPPHSRRGGERSGLGARPVTTTLPRACPPATWSTAAAASSSGKVRSSAGRIPPRSMTSVSGGEVGAVLGGREHDEPLPHERREERRADRALQAAEPAAPVLAAHDDQAAALGEQPAEQAHRAVAGDVEHDVEALVEGVEGGRRVVDDPLGAERPHQVGLGRAADAGDPGAEVDGELHGIRADAARAPMTSTRSPAFTPPARTACRAVIADTGTAAASSTERFAGRRASRVIGTTASSANEPRAVPYTASPTV